MNDPTTDLLAQAAAEPEAGLSKRDEVEAASLSKELDFQAVAKARSSGKGSQGLYGKDWDIRNLTPSQLEFKYGQEGVNIMRGVARGSTQNLSDSDEMRNRSWGGAAYDTGTGIASGFGAALGGTVALGTGLVDDEAGAWVSDKVRQGSDWVESTQSDAVNAARNQQRIASALDAADNEAQMMRERAEGSSDFSSGLRRWGRDSVDTLKNSTDSVMFAQGTSEALGSLVAGGPIAKSFKVVGAGALAVAGKARLVNPAGSVAMRAAGGTAGQSPEAIALTNSLIAARTHGSLIGSTGTSRIANAGGTAAWPAAIGAMEAGEGYSGTVGEIMSMSHDDLLQSSEPYRGLLQEGMEPEKAQLQLATVAGKEAAAIQGAVGASTGGLSRWAETPFKVASAASAAKNIFLKEPLEEAIQGGSGALAENLAVRKYADDTRTLSEGGGEQMVQGALYGFSAAGVVQGPGLSKQLLKETFQSSRTNTDEKVKKGLPLMRALAERGLRKFEEAEKESPVSEKAVTELSDAAIAAAPETVVNISEAVESSEASPEAKDSANNYVQTLADALMFNIVELQEEGELPSEQAEVLAKHDSRTGAIHAIADIIIETKDPDVALSAAATLTSLMEPIYNLQNSEPEGLEVIRSSPELNAALEELESVVANVETAPVKRALRAFNEQVTKNQDKGLIKPVTEESLNTQEGRQNVKNAVAVAVQHPDKGNLEASKQILTHAANGKLNLTPEQHKAVEASVRLLEAKEKADQTKESLGLLTARDVVSSQIVAGNDPLRTKYKRSAAQYTSDVLRSMRGRNLEQAAADLQDFGLFVEHMKNKLTANLEHYALGDPHADRIAFEQLQPDEERSWRTTKPRQSEFLNGLSEKSVEHSQAVNTEANTLADIYNGLVEGFPELGQEKIEMPAYPAELSKPAAEVVKDTREAAKKPTESPKKTEAKVEAKPAAPEPASEAEPTAVSRTTPEQANKLSDEILNDRIGQLMDRRKDDSATPTDNATFLVLDSEMTERESVAQKANEVQEAQEAAEAPITAKQATKLTDGDINDRINEITERRTNKAEKPVDEADFKVLDDEMAKRESADDSQQVQEAADKKAPVTQATEEVVPDAATVSEEQSRNVDMQVELDALNESTNEDSSVEEDAPLAPVDNVVEEKPGVDVNVENPTVPGLYNPSRNMFNESYSKREDPTTRIGDVESPAATVLDALSSKARLEKALDGESSKNVLTNEASEAYKGLLSLDPQGNTLGALMFETRRSLNKFLGKKWGKSGKSFLEIFREGLEIKKGDGTLFDGNQMNRMRNGKLLNIVEQSGDTFKYNQTLLEQAGLATMQWLMSADQYGSLVDAQALQDMSGVDPVYLTDEQISALSEGMSGEEAVRSLGDKIFKYWGLKKNKEADIAYSEGIPHSMAAEMLLALEEMGLLQITEVKLSAENLKTAEDSGPRTIKRYIPSSIDKNDALHTFPDAIETVVLVTPDSTNYFGENMPPVSERQMNNPEVPNTTDQMDALNKETKTPFNLNTTMASFLTALGENNLLSLFGEQIGDEKLWNKNDLVSLKGKNRSITDAFKHMTDTVNALTNHAKSTGENVQDVVVRYGYNMSRVGRMQMLGKYTPQASKLMREVFLPTKTTVDLSSVNTEGYEAFSLGLAQAFGIKIHNMTLNQAQQKLNEKLDKMDPAVEMLREWLREADTDNPMASSNPFTAEQVDALKSAFKTADADLGFVGLHALIDFARLQESTDKANFTTSVYVEADGVTNGPINAMALMTLGTFSEKWIKNIRKGGLNIGVPKTMAEIHQSNEENSKDLYQESANATREYIGRKRTAIGQQENGTAVLSQMDHLLNLMDLFNEDVSFDSSIGLDDGGLTMKRGITKNPLTITVYGSGAGGIASKMVNDIVSKMYSNMSQVMRAQKNDPGISLADAMFPNDPRAQAKADKFEAAFEALTTSFPVAVRGDIKLSKQKTNRKGLDPAEFTLNSDEFSSLKENMLEFFVKPMRAGIESVVGKQLIDSVGLLRDATQVQSILYQHQYQQAMKDLLAEKAKTDPLWRIGDFMSEQDKQFISKKLKKVAPLIETGAQTFMASTTKRVQVDGKDIDIGASLDDRVRTGPTSYMPGEAGVRGIPLLVIGMGDGMMMQLLAQLGLEGTLKIFDGMNMPLDKIKEYSQKSNEAVFDSWKDNPMRHVSEMFDQFLENYDPDAINEETHEALARSLFDFSERDDASSSDIRTRMEKMSKDLQWAAQSMDARQEALRSMPLSLDQMAAVGMPFTNGIESLQEMTDTEVKNELNERYKALMEKYQNEDMAPTPVAAPAKPSPTLEGDGRVDPVTGATTYVWDSLTSLFKKGSDSQKAVWKELRKSETAKGYAVVTGTAEQLDAHIAEKGLEARPDQDVFGWISIGDKTIYMINPSSETMVHELVHASSFETVLSHYEGKSTPEAKAAIERLEVMMGDFLNMSMKGMDPETRRAFSNAKDAILNLNMEESVAMQNAKALNEFMAWALSNQQLAKTLKTRQVPKLAQMVKDVIEAIKTLVWGKKTAPEVTNDFFSNLLFNSAILFRGQPSLSKTARSAELFHSEAYGTSDRITGIRQTFGRMVLDYIGDEDSQKTDEGIRRKIKVDNVHGEAGDIRRKLNATGFPMSPQESIAFRMVIAAMTTETQIDPLAMARAQELYSHVTKNLTVESFMADPESTDPAVRYYAQEKYDAIMGKTIVRTDTQGRSSLLPVFMGLSMVSEEFREVLSKIPSEKSQKNTDGNMDAVIENAGHAFMDKLSDRLSGDMNSDNVKDSIDNLTKQIRKVAMDEQNLIEQTSKKAGGIMNSLNDYVVENVSKLSDLGMEKGKELEKNSKNKMTTYAARGLQLVSSVASEKNGAIVSEQTMTMLNKSGVWEPFHKLMSDLIGRTASNSLIYDMIKVTRSMVQRTRQQFRETTPRAIMDKFVNKISDDQWGTTFRAMANTDLALFRDTMTHAEIGELFTDPTAVGKKINALEADIQSSDPRHWNLIQTKSKQLARFMNGEGPGVSLLRNANIISKLFGERVAKGRKLPNAATVAQIDQLISLYALEMLSKADKIEMASLVQGEAEGMNFMLDYLVGQRKEEKAKSAKGKANVNAYKGYIPSEQEAGVSMTVALDSDYAKLRSMGYERVGDYKGSSTETLQAKRGYYYAPVSGKSIFNQGIMQNVRHTAGGVDATSGYTIGQVAGRITNKHQVRRLAVQMKNETNTSEALMPVWNQYGQVVALERAMDPVQKQRVKPSQHLPKMIGVWRGRQAEEGLSAIYNKKLVDNLKTMYDKDMNESKSNQKQYINLFGEKLTPVQQDAVGLMTEETMEYIREVHGEEFWVRKDMFDDSVGYRSATIADAWTGNTKWSEDTQKMVRNMAIGAFGIDAYRYMVRAEQTVQNFMADARTLIVIKSVVVPILNFMSNVYQLISRGVPILSIGKRMPEALAEIDSYNTSNLRLINAEAELRAATGNPVATRKLKVEIQSIKDSHKRLSIWPLLEAGEFSTIADVGMTSEELELSSGKLMSYIDGKVEKLPEGVRNAGRQALITKDTSLFKGLQKSVQYGDFVAKAALYQDLTKRKGLTSEQALARVTEEFVNYDRLPGRFRSYMENMGLLWFYNFKIRISKIAVSTIRNNPVHALFAYALPTTDIFGNVDLPQADGLFSKLFEGTMGYSTGPGMALRAPSLNPWWNLLN